MSGFIPFVGPYIVLDTMPRYILIFFSKYYRILFYTVLSLLIHRKGLSSLFFFLSSSQHSNFEVKQAKHIIRSVGRWDGSFSENKKKKDEIIFWKGKKRKMKKAFKLERVWCTRIVAMIQQSHQFFQRPNRKNVTVGKTLQTITIYVSKSTCFGFEFDFSCYGCGERNWFSFVYSMTNMLSYN